MKRTGKNRLRAKPSRARRRRMIKAVEPKSGRVEWLYPHEIDRYTNKKS